MTSLMTVRARAVWGVGRWWLAAAALPLLWACNPHTLGPPRSNPNVVVVDQFPSALVRKLDVLFMIDNSQSMQPLQAKLIQQFPSFMEQLKKVSTADGKGTALPDIHVAVISSDTGPGQFLNSGGCHFGGDQGMFQWQARGGCTASPLHSTPTQQTFLSASMNQTVRNYDGDIDDAFRCIAALGDTGCGFEGQLKSVRLALDPQNTPAGNQGFLRDDALLAVVLITNEDDCSVPDDSDLFDPQHTLITDPYGPLASFRCNEFGHLCNIDGKLQPPPRGPATDLMGCVSNETATGKLTKVADEVAFLKGLKSDPRQVFVAALAGLPTSYSVAMVSPGAGVAPVPTMVHSCIENTGEYADPAVRIQQWVKSFGDHGLLKTICADDFGESLATIGDALGVLLGPQCVSGTLIDKDPSKPALDPECQVMDSDVDDDGQTRETPLRACSVDPTPPCWTLDDDAIKCPGAKTLNVTRDATPLPANLRTSITCATCAAGVARAGCACVVGKDVPGCLP